MNPVLQVSVGRIGEVSEVNAPGVRVASKDDQFVQAEAALCAFDDLGIVAADQCLAPAQAMAVGQEEGLVVRTVRAVVPDDEPDITRTIAQRCKPSEDVMAKRW